MKLSKGTLDILKNFSNINPVSYTHLTLPTSG